MQTILLSIAYLGVALLAMALCVGVGVLLRPLRAGRTVDLLVDAGIAGMIGMAVLSWWTTVCGLLGVLRWWALWPPLAVAGLVGLARAARCGFSPAGAFASARRAWSVLPRAERVACVVVGAACALLAANTLVGGLCPDHGQDSVWYHLTVPYQWVLRGDVAMFSHCMPSTYTLAGEALYAVLLTAWDEILPTAFYAWMLVFSLGAFVAVAWSLCGGRAALLTAALVPFLHAVNSAVAPIGAFNDAFASTAVLASAWLLARPRSASANGTLLAGFVGGFAVMAKVIAVGFLAPAVALVLGARWLNDRSFPRLLAHAAAFSVAFAVASMPWMVRGYVECGNPLIHVSREFMPIVEEFQPVIVGYDREPNRLFPFTPSGILDAFTRGLAKKFHYAMVSMDGLFLLAPLAALFALARRESYWRAQGLAVLACYAGLAMLDGFGEVSRYFSLAYPLAAPVLGLLCAEIARRFAGRRLAAIALVFVAASGATFAKKQLRWASFATIDWHFRPVVTDEARRAYVEHTEMGGGYLQFEGVRDLIPKDASVLVSDFPGPYKLERKAWWDCFACEPILGDWWKGMDARQAGDVLEARSVDYILQTNVAEADPRIGELERAGRLERIPVPPPWTEGTGLWRVVRP